MNRMVGSLARLATAAIAVCMGGAPLVSGAQSYPRPPAIPVSFLALRVAASKMVDTAGYLERAYQLKVSCNSGVEWQGRGVVPIKAKIKETCGPWDEAERLWSKAYNWWVNLPSPIQRELRAACGDDFGYLPGLGGGLCTVCPKPYDTTAEALRREAGYAEKMADRVSCYGTNLQSILLRFDEELRLKAEEERRRREEQAAAEEARRREAEERRQEAANARQAKREASERRAREAAIEAQNQRNRALLDNAREQSAQGARDYQAFQDRLGEMDRQMRADWAARDAEDRRIQLEREERAEEERERRAEEARRRDEEARDKAQRRKVALYDEMREGFVSARRAGDSSAQPGASCTETQRIMNPARCAAASPSTGEPAGDLSGRASRAQAEVDALRRCSPSLAPSCLEELAACDREAEEKGDVSAAHRVCTYATWRCEPRSAEFSKCVVEGTAHYR